MRDRFTNVANTILYRSLLICIIYTDVLLSLTVPVAMNDKTYARTADGVFSVEKIRRRTGFPRICWLLLKEPEPVIIRLGDESGVLPVFSSERKARKFITDIEKLLERPLDATPVQDNLGGLIDRDLTARVITLNIDLDEPGEKAKDRPHILLPRH